MSAIANGIVYVAGLSYINIRAEKQERPMRIALCHAWKLIGFSIVLTICIRTLNGQGSSITTFYEMIGYILLGTSFIFVLCLIVNEYRQRQGLLYNYKDCLDLDNAIANNYCKLFSKNEVIIERNPTVSASGMWKSTENLLPKNKKNYTNLWTIYMMLPKLHGALLFHYLLVIITFAETPKLFEWEYSNGIVSWVIAVGSVIGCILLRYFNGTKVYSLTSVFAIIFMGVVYAFAYTNNKYLIIFLWLYFFVASIAVAVPDTALMEISKIRFSEGALAIGYFVEIIPIAALQATQNNAITSRPDILYNEKSFLAISISTIVILVVTSILYQLHMPNTWNKSLLQIQNELLKYKKYFVFTFEEDVNSAVNRRPIEGNNYTNNISSVNVFEDHAKNMSNGVGNDYTEVSEAVPDPPVNKVINYDYNKEVPKPPAIIPRVKINRSQPNSVYGSHQIM